MEAIKKAIYLVLVYDKYLSNSWAYPHETKARKKFNAFSVTAYETMPFFFVIKMFIKCKQYLKTEKNIQP